MDPPTGIHLTRPHIACQMDPVRTLLDRACQMDPRSREPPVKRKPAREPYMEGPAKTTPPPDRFPFDRACLMCHPPGPYLYLTGVGPPHRGTPPEPPVAPAPVLRHDKPGAHG